MALETNFNQSPYFDDYEDSAKGKDYHRILFKPGLAVQTRELTQIQSILQDQVRRFGDNIFVEGTIIDGCNFQYDANVAFVKLRDRDPGGNTISVTAFANSIVQGLTSGVRAKVIATASGSEAAAPNFNTLLVKYISGGTSGTNKTFASNETISFLPSDGGNGRQANTLSSGAFGFGSIFNVGEGIVFGKGHFVNVQAQNIILEKYSTRPTARVGFKILESIVTSDTDPTLLDNARGSFNYTAPGADRLKLTATLVKRSFGTGNTESFTSIFEVEDGNVKLVSQSTVYDELGKEFAKRTYEESGNYFVKQINTSVKEHLNNGTNFGRFLAGGSIPGDKNKLAIGVEPGIAYVYGYRNEVLTTEYIETDKASTTKEEVGVTVTPNYGNYVDCDNVVGPWDPTVYQTISLRDAFGNAIDNGTFGATGAPGNQIGTANLRLVEYRSGAPGRNGVYRFYLFNINITASGAGFSDVKCLYVNNPSGPDNLADVRLTGTIAVLQEPSFNRVIFDTGIRAVKQLTSTSNTINTVFKYRDKTSLSFSVGGTATLTMGSPHAGGTEELDYGVGSLNDTQKATFQIVTTAAAETTKFSGICLFSTGSNTITGSSNTTFSTTLKAGDFIKVSNTGSDSSLLKVVSVASASSMVVNPRPDISDGAGGRYFKVIPAGYTFDMTDNGSTGAERTITVSTSTTAALDVKESFTGSVSATVFFNAQRENAVATKKTVRKNRLVKLDLSTNVGGVNGPWNLGVADVFNLRNVYIGTTYSTSNRKVTNDFRILKNDNDNLYKHSQLVLREGTDLSLTTGDRLLVEFDFFNHDRSGGIGFFSADSYVIDPNESTSNTTAIATPEIPRYDSKSAGLTFDLRDSIDFRPRVVSTATDTTVLASASINPSTSTTIDVDSDGSYVPVVNQNFETDLLFYLPRTDRVVIGKDGKKKVLKGAPSTKPFPPQEPAESMTLAILNIPPYPSLALENAFRFNRIDQAVVVKPLFQKRYTMQDIKGIESRIDRLEYYTALNILEKSAKDLNIPDENGLDRFKNGIFVDAFFGHGNSDLTDPAYNIAVDSARGELRPRFTQQNIDLRFLSGTNVTRKGRNARLTVTGATGIYVVNDVVFVGGSLGGASGSGTVRAVVSTGTNSYRLYLHDTIGTFSATSTLNNNTRAGTATISSVQLAPDSDLVTLPYTHVSYINQPAASKVINPVGELSFNWIGELTLNPPADHWIDTTSQPDVQFELDLATNWQSLQQAWGTQWNEWNTTTSESSQQIQQAQEGLRITTDVTTTTIDQQVRDGIRLDVTPFTNVQNSGQFVTSVDTIPFMRSRVIQFTGTGLRPNTRLFPYFDNIDVSSFVVPTNSSFTPTGPAGGALVTDSSGNVFGTFLVPNTDSLKFRSGERPFKLIDIANLVTQAGTETTSATAIYVATGLSTSVQGITFSTRDATLTSTTLTDNREVSTTTVVTTFRDLPPPPQDPIAQTFIVGNFERSAFTIFDNNFGSGADGVFVSAIDLFFSAKSLTQGIAVEIREVQAGVITSRRVPFGFKKISADDVNISADGTVPTPFYFDAPVYLRGDREYAMVIKPEGSVPDYRVWLAELGGTDVATNTLIDQQPAVGMLFTSSNDRTYTPRQNQDLKFRVWRASFSTNVTGVANYTNEEDEYLEIAQITGRYQTGETIRGESIIKMFSNTAAISIGDSVIFGSNTGIVRQIVTSGAQPTFKADMKGNFPGGAALSFVSGSGSYSGIANSITANTTTGQIQYFDPTFGDLVANNSSGNFSSNTTIDNGFYRGQTSNATSQVYRVKDFRYNVLVPKISFARYLDTDVQFRVRTSTNSYSISSSFTDVLPFENNVFVDNEKAVAGRTRELASTSGNKTLTLQATMSTGNERISPVLDLGRTKSVILVNNVINNQNNGEFGNYGVADARYISKKVVLADGQEAEDIKVIISAYKPPGTEVDVFVRVQNEEDNDEFRDKHYTKLDQITSSLVFSSVTQENDYREFEYGFPSTNATSLGAFKFSGNNNVVRYFNTANAHFDTFKSFSIKVVLRSALGSHVIPRVKDLRAIALQI